MGLSFESLNAEVKPTWPTIGIRLLLQLYLIRIAANYLYLADVSTLKVTLESDRPDWNYLTPVAFLDTDVFVQGF